ncbi:MAG: STAS domain-containing protein [Actinobacteria bacterium]|nr:MAG: STAS domain-containing protein [Actinomycetota bacterium]
MDVDISYPGEDAAVVSVRGALDIDTASEVRAAFDTLSDRAVIRIVADLTGLEFCDSIGLSTLIVAHRRCTDAGGWVRIAGPAPFLVRLLSVVGVAEAVSMYKTVDGAVRGDADQLVPPYKDDLAA